MDTDDQAGKVASIQPNTHSFILKVWLHETDQKTGRITWRGWITHVPSGRRCHFTDVDEITSFVLPYLHELGVKPTLLWKLRQKLGW